MRGSCKRRRLSVVGPTAEKRATATTSDTTELEAVSTVAPKSTPTMDSSSCSKTSLRRALGGGYRRGLHPVKLAVNEWICSLANGTLAQSSDASSSFPTRIGSRSSSSSSPNFQSSLPAECNASLNQDHWVLILETGAAQTVDCLLRGASTPGSSLNISASRIVVPNPSLSVCRSLSKTHPSLISFPVTSHKFFREICENRANSSISSTLLRAGWSGTFDLVWLDYCGTFSSKAGRRRQADIRRLFRFGLLSSPSLLVATASQRGAVTYYEDEIIDDMLGFLRRVGSGEGTGFGGRDTGEGGVWDCGRGGVVSAAAKAVTHTASRKIECAGVAIHSVTSRMYTVAVAIDSNIEDDSGRNRDGDRPEKIKVEMPNGSTSLVHTYARWQSLENIRNGSREIRKTTPLWQAWAKVAQRFAREVASCRARDKQNVFEWNAIIMDNKLLQVSLAMLSLSGGDSGADKDLSKIFAIVPSPVEAALANDRLDRLSFSSRVQVVMESVSRATRHDSSVISFQQGKKSDPSKCRAVWLSYHATKAMGAAELHRCDKWSDVNNLLERGWINAGGQLAGLSNASSNISCLGVHIKYSNIGLVWHGSHVDWLISGMCRAAKHHGLHLETRYVCDFTFRAPHVVVIFRVVRAAPEHITRRVEVPVVPASKSEESKTKGSPVIIKAGSHPGWNMLPTHFEEFEGEWPMIGHSKSDFSNMVSSDADGCMRNRIPSSSSQKYSRNITPWIFDFVLACNLNHYGIVLCEPGFNHILPVLLHSDKFYGRLTCAAAKDYIQFEELKSRRSLFHDSLSSHYCVTLDVPEIPAKLPSDGAVLARTAILFSDGGLRAWRATWLQWTKKWIRSVSATRPSSKRSQSSEADSCTDRPNLNGALVILASASKDTDQMTSLVQEVVKMAENAGVLARSLPIHYFHWEHVPFGLVSLIFGPSCTATESSCVTRVWEQAQSL